MSRPVHSLARPLLALAVLLAVAAPLRAEPSSPPAALSLQGGKETPRYAIERLSATRCRLWLRGVAWTPSAETAGLIAGAAWRAQSLGEFLLVDFWLAAPGAVSVAYDAPARRLAVTFRPEGTLAAAGKADDGLRDPEAWPTAPPLLAGTALPLAAPPPSVRPAPPTPSAVPTPAPSPSPQPSPSPSRAPALPSPSASSGPSSSPSGAGGTARIAVETGFTFFQESLPAGGLDLGPALVPSSALSAAYELPNGLLFDGRFRFGAHVLQDASATQSLHRRSYFSLDLNGAYPLRLEDLSLAVGGGYSARYLTTASTLPPPLSQPLLFSPSELFHGPRLFARWRGAPGEGWKAMAEVSSHPFLMATGDAAVGSLTPLFAYGARLGLDWTPTPGLSLGLAYPVELITGYAHDFYRLEHGPVLTGAWSF